MNPDIIFAASAIGAIISFLIAMFQIVLVLGFPYGEAAWGGRYKILTKKLRLASLVAFFYLIFSGFNFLIAGRILPEIIPLNTSKIILWIIIAFLALNTLGNLASKSKYEKIIMTPVTFLMLLCGLIITIFG